MRSVKTTSKRAENMNRLFKHDRHDLFFTILNTLLMLEDRGITQAEIARKCGRNREWVRQTLTASPTLSHKRMAKNLEDIDDAITAITNEKGLVFDA